MVLSIMLYACGTKVVLESVVLVNKCALLARLRDCMREQMDRATVKSGIRDWVNISSELAQDQCARDVSFLALEYREGSNQVIPKSSPLQGMKAQSLQSLFVGEVTHASYQPSNCHHARPSNWPNA